MKNKQALHNCGTEHLNLEEITEKESFKELLSILAQ